MDSASSSSIRIENSTRVAQFYNIKKFEESTFRNKNIEINSTQYAHQKGVEQISRQILLRQFLPQTNAYIELAAQIQIEIFSIRGRSGRNNDCNHEYTTG